MNDIDLFGIIYNIWPHKRTRESCFAKKELKSAHTFGPLLCRNALKDDVESMRFQAPFMHLSMSSPGGGGSSGDPREFDCDAYPQGGDFDLTSCIWSVNFKE